MKPIDLTNYLPPIERYLFCAVQSPDCVRLGKVMAYSDDSARANIQKFFIGGYFFPNQIYVWPERLNCEISSF